MQYTINELKAEIFQRVFEVYGIFQNHFGEERVDLQNIPTNEDILPVLEIYELVQSQQEDTYEVSSQQFQQIKEYYSSLKPTILVYWPRVTVTNENNRSVDIQDLYAKIKIDMEGKIPWEFRGFMLTRTTFSELQYTSGYCHSHVPHISGIPTFQLPCLGSGPINHTIMDLKNNYEEALWMLFCEELSRYVTVESLTGGPYFRMESIGSEKLLHGYSDYEYAGCTLGAVSSFYRRTDEDKQRFKDMLKRFTKYYLEKGHLSLSYTEDKFVPGMPYFDFMIDISNSFIDFFNEFGDRDDVQELYDRSILIQTIVSNGKFYQNSRTRATDFSLEGLHILTFKGEQKNLHIVRRGEDERAKITLVLHNAIAMLILNNVLRIINYRYRNEHTKQLGSSSTAVTAPTYQTVRYL